MRNNTANNIKYFVIICNGKHIKLNHFAVCLELTEYCKLTILQLKNGKKIMGKTDTFQKSV